MPSAGLVCATIMEKVFLGITSRQRSGLVSRLPREIIMLNVISVYATSMVVVCHRTTRRL